MKKASKVKVPSKSKIDPADNGKGFKFVAKGKETGSKKFVPPWAKKKGK